MPVWGPMLGKMDTTGAEPNVQSSQDQQSEPVRAVVAGKIVAAIPLPFSGPFRGLILGREPMAKRDNSKAGAKLKAPRDKRSVRAETPGERAVASAVRPSRPKDAQHASRIVSAKAASTQRKSVAAPTHHSQANSAPLGATITRRAADRLRAGHLWVYASDVVSVTLPNPEEALIPVADQRGLLLGTALYSPSSQIALRLVSRESLDETAWLKLLASRLRAAIARRKPLLDAANDACRLCFSEADELPGLIADKYGDLVVLQFLTKGLLADGV